MGSRFTTILSHRVLLYILLGVVDMYYPGMCVITAKKHIFHNRSKDRWTDGGTYYTHATTLTDAYVWFLVCSALFFDLLTQMFVCKPLWRVLIGCASVPQWEFQPTSYTGQEATVQKGHILHNIINSTRQRKLLNMPITMCVAADNVIIAC